MAKKQISIGTTLGAALFSLLTIVMMALPFWKTKLTETTLSGFDILKDSLIFKDSSVQAYLYLILVAGAILTIMGLLRLIRFPLTKNFIYRLLMVGISLLMFIFAILVIVEVNKLTGVVAKLGVGAILMAVTSGLALLSTGGLILTTKR